MTAREEIKKAVKYLITKTPTLEKVEDVEFTIFLRECFLSIKGDLNTDKKTKDELYEKLVVIRNCVEEAWEELK